MLMRFKIGPDMGWVMSKAIAFSLLSVLCFLPALAIATYRLIDRTQHRSFVPKFDKFAAVVMKIRFPVLALIVLLLPASFLGQQNNDFFYGGSEVYSTEATQMGRDMQAINSMYGPSNPVVLMVPKGDMEKEISMNEELPSFPQKRYPSCTRPITAGLSSRWRRRKRMRTGMKK